MGWNDNTIFYQTNKNANNAIYANHTLHKHRFITINLPFDRKVFFNSNILFCAKQTDNVSVSSKKQPIEQAITEKIEKQEEIAVITEYPR